MEKKTEKITVSLSPEVIHLADQNWEKFGFKNRSELIDAAIREYISRDLLKEFTGELSQFYQKIERSEIKHLEEHLAKLSYKIAVEIAQMHLLMASITELSKQDTRDLRAKAVALVNESKGYISLETARKHKVPLQLEDDTETEDDGWWAQKLRRKTKRKDFFPQREALGKCELFDNSASCRWIVSSFYGMLCC